MVEDPVGTNDCKRVDGTVCARVGETESRKEIVGRLIHSTGHGVARTEPAMEQAMEDEMNQTEHTQRVIERAKQQRAEWMGNLLESRIVQAALVAVLSLAVLQFAAKPPSPTSHGAELAQSHTATSSSVR